MNNSILKMCKHVCMCLHEYEYIKTNCCFKVHTQHYYASPEILSAADSACVHTCVNPLKSL